MSYPPPPQSPPPGPPYGGPPGDGSAGEGAGGAPTQEDRTWALVAHIGSLVSAWFALGVLCPLLVLLLKGSQPFVRRHALESLNYQITLLLLIVAGTIISLVTLGLGLIVVIPAGIVIAVAALIFIIIATMRASDGREYRYPFCLRLVK